MKQKLAIAFAIVILVAGGAGVWLWNQDMPRTPGETFDSAGVPIHYTDQGAGEPVILIHGFAVHGDMNWRSPGVVDVLDDHFRVIVPDNRGHGLSGKPLDPADYGPAMADDVARLMDHLDIDRAHIVGCSLGSIITFNFLARHPDRVISAAPTCMGWPRADEESLALVNTLAKSLEEKGSIAPLIRKLREGGPEPSWYTLWSVDRLLMRMNDPMALAAVVRAMPDLEADWNRLTTLEAPVLTLGGDKDPLMKGAEELSEVIPHHQVIIVEDATHVNILGRPEFADHIKTFLLEQRTVEARDAA